MEHVSTEEEQRFPLPEQDFEIYKAAKAMVISSMLYTIWPVL
ncbi:hypothetical protein [Paenibacillus sp. UNC451MF]|nr:hypothetical protein [Paenibacillus sp. UNC451MF]